MLVDGSHGRFSFADDSADYFGLAGGGSEKFVHTNNLSENAPPPCCICVRSTRLTIVGGYMKGRKKKETEKSIKPIAYSVLILGLGALLFYRVSDPPFVAVYSAEWCPKHWMYHTRVSTVYRRTFASVRRGPACPAEQRNIIAEAGATT